RAAVLNGEVVERCRQASELRQVARALDHAGHHPLVSVRPTCIQRPNHIENEEHVRGLWFLRACLLCGPPAAELGVRRGSPLRGRRGGTKRRAVTRGRSSGGWLAGY